MISEQVTTVGVFQKSQLFAVSGPLPPTHPPNDDVNHVAFGWHC